MPDEGSARPVPIDTAIFGPDEIQSAADDYRDFICGETLSVQLAIGSTEGDVEGYDAASNIQIDDLSAVIALNREVEVDTAGGPIVAGAPD